MSFGVLVDPDRTAVLDLSAARTSGTVPVIALWSHGARRTLLTWFAIGSLVSSVADWARGTSLSVLALLTILALGALGTFVTGWALEPVLSVGPSGTFETLGSIVASLAIVTFRAFSARLTAGAGRTRRSHRARRTDWALRTLLTLGSRSTHRASRSLITV